jgi:hypothetical protein
MNPRSIAIVVLMFLFNATVATASIYEHLLHEIEIEFDEAMSKQDKVSILLRTINGLYVELLDPNEEIDYNRLGRIETPNERYYKTHPLALAIVHGKVDLLEKFLAVVDDINDEKLFVWGYREWYTMAHLALDPQHPSLNDSVTLETRREILRMLRDKGVNFNLIKGGLYANPAIACGRGSGQELDCADSLRCDALLYGADPHVRGSYYHLTESALGRLACDLLDASMDLHGRHIKTRPEKKTRAVLDREIDRRRQKLQSRKF